MSVFIKWVLIVLTLLFLLLADVMLLLYKQWPAWSSLIIILVFIGLILSGLFLFRFIPVVITYVSTWLREQYLSSLGRKKFAINDFLLFRRIEKNWKRAIREKRKTGHAGDNSSFANIPRYLIIGADRAGKTTAIKNSHTATPFIKLSEIAPSNCDNTSGWWFLDNAFMLDTPGRYVDQKTKGDLTEWRRCLESIRRTRRKIPLNGIVACISAKKLLAGGNIAQLEAINLRKCIYETIDHLGVVCPVYIIVTQCDAIEGMLEFFLQLPDGINAQAIGSLNNAESVRQFVRKTFELVYQRLRKLRLSIMGSQHSQNLFAPFVFLPERFLKLQESLINCVEIIFDKNERREYAGLRGLYFSSGHQEQAAAFASVSNNINDSSRPGRSLSGRALFLKDFFRKIIINDQYLVRPSGRREGLHKLFGSLAVVSVVLCSLVFGALLTLSFMQNLKVMRNAYNVMPPSGTVNQNLVDNISIVEQFRESIIKLDDSLNQLWHPLMGLRQAENVSGSLKEVYVKRYREGVIRPLDALLDKSLFALSDDNSLLQTADHITYLARRINLYRTSIRSSRPVNKIVKNRKTPDFHFILNVPEIKNKASARLATSYYTYLQWQTNKVELRKDLLADQDRMKGLLDRKGGELSWLTRWASSQGKSAFPGKKPYWGEDIKLPGGQSLRIDFAYTPEGWRRINEVLAEIELADKDSKYFSNLKRHYLENYRKSYFNHWETFLSNFYQGQDIWTDRENKIDLAYNLSNDNSPYNRVIRDAAIALEPILGPAQDAAQIPTWVNLLYRYIKLSGPADQNRTEKDGLIRKITDGSKSLFNKVAGKHRDVDNRRSEIQDPLDKEAIIYLNEYKESLGNMVRHLKTPQNAYQLVRAVFDESNASTDTTAQSVNINARALDKLKQKLGRGDTNEEVFWQLLSNQRNQIWHVLLEEAQVHIQHKWQNEVLAEETNLNGWELIDRLQGVDGAVWQFKKAELTPFLQANSITGYKSRKLYGGYIHFSKKFIGFLNRRALEADAINGSYRLNISALPTDVNVEASVKPHETGLTVHCLNGNQGLLNQNYPVSRHFVWAPRDCGNVEIEIKIGKLTLRKLYTGYRAFIRFLDDFHTGKKIFNIDEFPGQRRALEAYFVRSITVSYDISGRERIDRLQSRLPEVVPDKIITVKTGY